MLFLTILWVIVMHIFLAAVMLPAIAGLCGAWCDRLGGDIIWESLNWISMLWGE